MNYHNFEEYIDVLIADADFLARTYGFGSAPIGTAVPVLPKAEPTMAPCGHNAPVNGEEIEAAVDAWPACGGSFQELFARMAKRGFVVKKVEVKP